MKKIWATSLYEHMGVRNFHIEDPRTLETLARLPLQKVYETVKLIALPVDAYRWIINQKINEKN